MVSQGPTAFLAVSTVFLAVVYGTEVPAAWAQIAPRQAPAAQPLETTSEKPLDGIDSTDSLTSVPPQLVGVWKGMIHPDPLEAPDLDDFDALIALVNVQQGEVAGTVQHPSGNCIGLMRLQSSTAATVVVHSDYLLDHCLDGNHALTLNDDGSLNYAWHDPESRRVDRGTLIRATASESGLPSAYQGVWEGMVQADPDVAAGESWTIVTLTGGMMASMVGTIAHPGFACGGEMTLDRVDEAAISLQTHFSHGDCIDGAHRLSRNSDSELGYEWFEPGTSRVDTGRLRRISGRIDGNCLLDGFGDRNGQPLRQDVGAWSDLPYGGTMFQSEGRSVFLPFRYRGEGRDTIAAWGCYLSSAAMAINYLAGQQGLAFRTDPALLNEWLQQHAGYVTGGPLPSADDPRYVDTSFVRPTKIVEYANLNGVLMAFVGQESQEGHESQADFVRRTQQSLEAAMCNRGPVVLGVTNTYGRHYVAVSGREQVDAGLGLRIHDPLSPKVESLRASYTDLYRQIVRFAAQGPDRSLSVAVDAPVELLMTDAEGRRAGLDARTGLRHRSIPGSAYSSSILAAKGDEGSEMAMQVLDIVGAPLGTYYLEVLGTGPGEYHLELYAVDHQGGGTILRLDGQARPGSTDIYEIEYGGEPGDAIRAERRSVPIPAFDTGRLVNLSTRCRVENGDDAMIGGFILRGGSARVAIRAIGPDLANRGIASALADPSIEVHSGARLIAANDNWQTSLQADEIRDLVLAPSDPRESVVLKDLVEGEYTAIVRGNAGLTGVALVEAFKISGPGELVNLSTRCKVQADDAVMIGGFILRDEPATVVVRALGPSLSARGLAGALSDPSVQVYRGQELIAQNNNWTDAGLASVIRSAGLAPAFEAESAVMMRLPPGAYTAIVRGAQGQQGVGLVEVFKVMATDEDPYPGPVDSR